MYVCPPSLLLKLLCPLLKHSQISSCPPPLIHLRFADVLSQRPLPGGAEQVFVFVEHVSPLAQSVPPVPHLQGSKAAPPLRHATRFLFKVIKYKYP